MKPLYLLEGLEYSYAWNQQRVPVLKGINLSIEAPSFTCIQGPSGTGKTTLLNLLGLLDEPAAGKLTFLGSEVGYLPEKEKEQTRLKSIGYVFQSFYLIPTMTVLENTSYFLGPLGYDSARALKKSKEVLDLLGLQEHFNKKPLELSGGQRQRVAIARALVKSPSVILADEPTANLDFETSTRIIESFQLLQKTEGTSFIFSTHDPHLVSYAKELIQIRDGKVLSHEVRS